MRRSTYICRFFSIKIWSALLCSPGFSSLDSTNYRSKTVFPIYSWRLQMQRADCCSRLLHVRHLSILGFWKPHEERGILEPMTLGYWETTVVKFGGNQKLYLYIWQCGRQYPKPSCCSRATIVNLYMDNWFIIFDSDNCLKIYFNGSWH